MRPSVRSGKPLRLADEPGERCEVERDLGDPACAEVLDRLDDEELGEAVRRVAVAAHERERDGVAAVRRHEVEEAADRTALVGGGDDERFFSLRIAQRVHRHAEAALGRAAAPVVRDLLEPATTSVVERAELGDRRVVAGLPQARNRLANLADRASLETEALRIDDRLVAEVERAQAGLLEQRARLAG